MSKGKELVLASDNVDLELWADIAYEMASPDPDLALLDEDGQEVKEPTLSMLKRRFGLSKRQAIQIIAHPKFATFFHNMQQAIAKINFDRKVFRRLDEIIETGHDRDAVHAAKLAAQLVDYHDDRPVNVFNFSFDRIVRQLETARKGEDIVDAEVTEAEDYPGL